jgi:hypothetical protein
MNYEEIPRASLEALAGQSDPPDRGTGVVIDREIRRREVQAVIEAAAAAKDSAIWVKRSVILVALLSVVDIVARYFDLLD